LGKSGGAPLEGEGQKIFYHHGSTLGGGAKTHKPLSEKKNLVIVKKKETSSNKNGAVRKLQFNQILGVCFQLHLLIGGKSLKKRGREKSWGTGIKGTLNLT